MPPMISVVNIYHHMKREMLHLDHSLELICELEMDVHCRNWTTYMSVVDWIQMAFINLIQRFMKQMWVPDQLLQVACGLLHTMLGLGFCTGRMRGMLVVCDNSLLSTAFLLLPWWEYMRTGICLLFCWAFRCGGAFGPTITQAHENCWGSSPYFASTCKGGRVALPWA